MLGPSFLLLPLNEVIGLHQLLAGGFLFEFLHEHVRRKPSRFRILHAAFDLVYQALIAELVHNLDTRVAAAPLR